MTNINFNYEWFKDNKHLTVLHSFHRRLSNYDKNLIKDIKNQGFNAIQIAPVQPVIDPYSDAFWMFYQILDFTIANKEELKRFCSLCQDEDIAVIGDIVPEHVAGCADNHLWPNEKVAKRLTKNPYFFRERKNIQNWNDHNELQNYCQDLPGLRLDNYDLQDIIIRFLNELLECGMTGFRIDAAKHIAFPDKGCHFFTRVFDNLIIDRKNIILYGEILFENNEFFEKFQQYMKALTTSDFYNKDAIVKFVDSPDFFIGQQVGNTSYISSQDISRIYYEICKWYPNTLYYVRPNNGDNNAWLNDSYRGTDQEWRSEIVKEANKQKQLKYGK